MHGMNAIQWACAAGLAVLGVLYLNDRRALRRKTEQHVVVG
jgi:hypothetical protein